MPTLINTNKNLSSEIRFRVPNWLRGDLEKRAKKINISLSEYARNVFLMVMGAFNDEIDRVSKIESKGKLTDGDIDRAIKEVRKN